MQITQRTRWTEAEVDDLPPGEHDYFERKSGQLFADVDNGELLASLSKAISALANSGGGHIILGVGDNGIADGVPRMRGKATMRDWLEQKVPRLVEYPLSAFRVHIVERSTPTRIPEGRDVIVIDIGDSPLAPHQTAIDGRDKPKYTYYYRQGGRSERAPHFYLELLRRRLIGAELVAELTAVESYDAGIVENQGLFVAMRLRFMIKNVGRLAAYNYAINIVGAEFSPAVNAGSIYVGRVNFPERFRKSDGIGIDKVLLPGISYSTIVFFGTFVHPAATTKEAIKATVELTFREFRIHYRVVTETSSGTTEVTDATAMIDALGLAESITNRLGLSQ